VAHAEHSSPVKVQQCLFGYNDGHKLLAGSVRLPAEAASLVLLLSDLAPGASISELEGYWTGVPLPSARSYALIRTWAAPEMRRPGCVWSHALIVNFTDIAAFADLGTLRKLTSRPAGPNRGEDYGMPLVVDPDGLGTERSYRRVSHKTADVLVGAVYGASKESAVLPRDDEIEDALFALWSQQWPRLRRSFSFRTAGAVLETSGPVRFDVQLTTGAHSFGHRQLLSDESADGVDWVGPAVVDLTSRESTEFRRFLWRYGSDIQRGRERFQTLATIFAATRHQSSLSGSTLHGLLRTVAAAFPAARDGATLKQDLVACGQSAFSFLPPADPLETLRFLILNAHEHLPAPPGEVFEAAATWGNRREEVISIALLAAEHPSAVSDTILRHLAVTMEPASFLEASISSPELRRRLVSLNPRLLLSDKVLDIPREELFSLLADAPDGASVVEPLLQYLIHSDDAEVASEMYRRLPVLTTQLVMSGMRDSIEGSGKPIGGAWTRLLRQSANEVLGKGFVEAARSTRLLAAIAAALSYDSPSVLRFGPMAWSRALAAAKDDVQGRDRQMFLSFLLALGLANPTPESQALFELAFEEVHKDLSSSRLPNDAKSMLSRHLPVLSWWDQWDVCKRLRMGVVRSLTNNRSPTRAELTRLTSDRYLLEKLTELTDADGF
jgi:GTPase-associated protein 1, N-terminal domain type 1